MEWTAHPVKENIKITGLFTFFRKYYDNTYEFTGESHDFWECLYVVDGSLCVSADGKVYNLSAGEIIFHKPRELHKFHITDPGGADIIVFSYSAEGDLCDFFREKVFLLSRKQREIITELIDYAESYAECQGDSKNYIDAWDRVDMYPQNVSIHVQRLMLSMAEKSSVLPVSKTSDSVVFAKAVKYMNDRIYDNPSTEDISAYVNLSVSSVKRIFNRYAGMGIHKYFMKLKLKKAADLLDEGNTVTFVAEKLNFSSQGYFTKAFKRETGMLPSAFK